MSGLQLAPHRLHIEMARRGLRGSDLAQIAKISPATVSHALNGRRIATSTLHKLAIALSQVPALAAVDDLLDPPTAA
jgi:DNA-binding Xre family transcriptional regulator